MITPPVGALLSSVSQIDMASGSLSTPVLFQNTQFILKEGVEKEREANISWSMVKPEKAAPVTQTTLRTTGPVPADSRQ